MEINGNVLARKIYFPMMSLHDAVQSYLYVIFTCIILFRDYAVTHLRRMQLNDGICIIKIS